MAEIGAHDLKEGLYPFDGYPGIEEIALNAEGFSCASGVEAAEGVN